MRHFLPSMVAAAVLAAAAGCGGNVVLGSGGGGNGGGGNGGGGNAGANAGGSTSSVDPTGMPAQGYALALEHPGSVHIHFASAPITCASPDISTSPCGTWEITIKVLYGSFVPGTLDLNSGEFEVWASESANGSDPKLCAGGVGGTALPATLTIHAIGDASAELELQGFNSVLLDGKPDGPYTAPICHVN